MKIWAKLVTGDRIPAQTVYSSDLPTKYLCYCEWVADICRELDLSVPVILPQHYKNFVMFNNTRFKQDDFLDDIGADMLMIENCKE